MTDLTQKNTDINIDLYDEEGFSIKERVQINEKTISLLEQRVSQTSNNKQIYEFKNIISTLRTQNAQLSQAI